ncbi:MAG: hypothetical protein IKP02_06315 [Paludibacteraceae bacterium]|nr:hypothetical protein [Paludibacteraceae bacterium]
MKKIYVFGLLILAVVLKGTSVYAQGNLSGERDERSASSAKHAEQPSEDGEKYAWRLDEVASIYDQKDVSDSGDTISSGSLVRYFYTDSSFSVVQYPVVYRIKDTIEVYKTVNKTEYDQIGANGKHMEKTYQIRLRGSDWTVVRYLDSIPQADPFADTLIAPTSYSDYAYDTYRNVYDGEGNLLRQIRNYDYTRYFLDSDSLLELIEKYKDSTDFPVTEWNQLPYEEYDRNVLIQTDSSSLAMQFVYGQLQSPIREERYADHILSMKSEINIKPYNNKPSRVTKSTRYNKYGTKTGTYELTERWTEDSVPTYYTMKDVSYLEGDSVLEIKESRSWSTDTAGVKHLTITREERLYDSSSDQTIYAKKTISTDGIEQTRNEEEWIIEVTPNGKKGHMLYQDQTDVATHGTYITVNNVARYIPLNYTTICETHKRYRYDEHYTLIYASDSSQSLTDYKDTIEWEGQRYATYLKRPVWNNYTVKEYAADGSLQHERAYKKDFITDWFLISEKTVTDEYTWSMSVNMKDTTRTTSKKFTNGWDSESTKEKLDIERMSWYIDEANEYRVSFDVFGEPVSAMDVETKKGGTDQYTKVYLFHHWDEKEQRYIRQSVAWIAYDTADFDLSYTYNGETVHAYKAEDYTYYDRKGGLLGFYYNTCSTCSSLKSEYIVGLYDKRHYDAQGRMDTLYRYAFYGEWYLIRYFTYEYFPEEGENVVAKRHSYSIVDSDQESGLDFRYPNDDLFEYQWWGYRWNEWLSGRDTSYYGPLHDMQYIATATYSHTFSTYNDDGVLLETRTYNNGSMTPVTQTHNTFTYDAEGRVAVHVAYKDSVPDTKKIYFYSEQTGEQTACITWSGYNKETGAWSKFAFANSGEHIVDGEGRIVALTNYAASADSTGIVPAERYEYHYDAGETDWTLADRYVWQEGEWVCSSPTYRGFGTKHYVFDEDGNMVSRSLRTATCGGLNDAQSWSFSYGSPLSQYSLLSPQAYGVAEANLATFFTNEDWLARPLTGHYTRASQCQYNYTISFRYTAQREEPVTFREPVTVEPEEESAFFTWPKVDGATGYSLTIWADEAHTVKLCTILFDAKGTVLAIDFSHMPARNQPSAISYQYSAIPSVALWQTEFSHRIEDLSPGTTYWYTLTASGEQGGILDSRSGSFRTKGEGENAEGIDFIEENDTNTPVKFLRNGQIIIRRGDAEYSIQGNQIK